MDYMHKTWSALIDITSVCPNTCIYCTRYTRHLRTDQRRHMPLDKIEAAIIAYKDWPSMVSIIGGEPLMHPQFAEVNALLRRHLPQEKLNIFTSGLPGMKKRAIASKPAVDSKYSWVPEYAWSEWPEGDCDMTRTYRTIRYNAHDAAQQEVCSHHPLTLAVGDAVQDEALKWKLINNCWVQRIWSPTVNINGAYFCEVGAAIDRLLHDGANAWPVEPGWWRRAPHEFQAQASKLCAHCGMCLPMQRQRLGDTSELFSTGLLKLFKDKKLRNMDTDITVLDKRFSTAEIETFAERWYPSNYREDLVEDDAALSHLKGIDVPLSFADGDPYVFKVDSDDDFKAALRSAAALPLAGEPHLLPAPRHFLYQGMAFDPLKDQYPFVLEDNAQGQELYKRSMLLYLRPLLPEADFEAFLAAASGLKLSLRLYELFWELYGEHHRRILREKAAALAGKEVYFWGCGASYKKFAGLFAAAKPVAFLIDMPGYPAQVEGIPVIHPKDLTADDAKPVIVFTRKCYLPSLVKNLEHKYAHVALGAPVWAVLE